MPFWGLGEHKLHTRTVWPGEPGELLPENAEGNTPAGKEMLRYPRRLSHGARHGGRRRSPCLLWASWD